MNATDEAEAMVSIPRVPIYIPGPFGRPKFEPAYVLPLFQEVWKLRTAADPTQPVCIKEKSDGSLDWPAELCVKGIPDPLYSNWRVPADDPCRWEEMRLRRDFGDAVFEKVFPGRNDFAQAFAEVMKPAPAPVAPAPSKK